MKTRIAEIQIGERHRKDLGDLAALAGSIQSRGLLHPPVVTRDGSLVCGYRRVMAAKSLGWDDIEVRRLNPDDLLMAERDENELRKEFTPSERVAIARAIEEAAEQRKGRPSNGSKENGANCPEFPKGERTADVAAKKAGFESRKSFERAAKVVEQGAPELVEAMDAGDVSVSAAAEVATLPKREQKQVVNKGPAAVKEKAAALRKAKKEPPAPGPEWKPVEEANGEPPPQPASAPVIEGDMGETDLSDDEWLAALPARGKLHPTRLKTFDADALLYRKLETARKTFQHHASRALKGASKGAYGFRVSQFLRTDHPRHWLVCPATEHGGCGGSGTIRLVGECQKCFGRGYWINR